MFNSFNRQGMSGSQSQMMPNLTMPTQAQGSPQGLPFQGGNFPGQGNPMMGNMPNQAQGMPQGLPFQGGGFPGQGRPMMGTMPSQAQGTPQWGQQGQFGGANGFSFPNFNFPAPFNFGGGNFGANRFQGYNNQAGILGFNPR
jgi:hypothetical protein